MDPRLRRFLMEAPPIQMQQPQQQQQQMPPQQEPQQDELGVMTPEQPPDFTGGGDPNQDPNAAMMTPNQQQQMMDPNQQQQMEEDPNQQQEVDPNQDPNAAGMEEDPNAMSTIQGPEDEIKQAEKDTFSDLSPEQMIIKNNELKERYSTLHSIIIDSLDKINNISHTTYDDNMLDFVSKKLMALKTLIRDALIDAFPTRTYVENKIELQRFIVIYNHLANIISEIYKSRVKRQERIKELNNLTKNYRDPEEFPVFSRGYDTQ